MRSINVIIIEDDIVFAGLQLQKINSIEGFNCTQIFTDAEMFLSARIEPDIVLLDLVMPKMSGMTALPLILQKYPKASIVINSIKEDIPTILEAISLGAVGYIDKQSYFDMVEIVLQNVKKEGAYMTPKIARKIFDHFKRPEVFPNVLTQREMEVASLIKNGKSYKEVAEICSISIDTVRMHIRNIYKKLNINSKIQLANIISNSR